METKSSTVSITINTDRISELSNELIHHIFFFLNIRTAVQTSILSRRWRHLWSSLPIIRLHDIPFIKSGDEYFVTLNRFINFADRFLYLRDSTADIQTLDLLWLTAERHLEVVRYDIANRINTWIMTAVKHNLQELRLFVIAFEIFQLPDCFFSCKSLTKLEFSGAGMGNTGFALPNTMHLPRLRYLELNGVSLADESLTSKLFSSCPVLESLLLTDCSINFDFSSLSLKHFKLDNRYEHPDNYSHTVKLCAPNLISIICEDYMSQDYSLENLSSLVTADIGMTTRLRDTKDCAPETWKTYSKLATEVRELYAVRMMNFLRAVCNVKDLKLSSPGFLEVVSGSLNLLGGHYFQFRNLRSMNVVTWMSKKCLNAIAYLVEMSPDIESLFITTEKMKFSSTNTGQDWVAGSSFPCLKHLKYVEIRGFQGCFNELKFLKVLLKKADVLEKVTIFSDKSDSPDRAAELMEFNEMLLAFPSASSSVSISIQS